MSGLGRVTLPCETFRILMRGLSSMFEILRFRLLILLAGWTAADRHGNGCSVVSLRLYPRFTRMKEWRTLFFGVSDFSLSRCGKMLARNGFRGDGDCRPIFTDRFTAGEAAMMIAAMGAVREGIGMSGMALRMTCSFLLSVGAAFCAFGGGNRCSGLDATLISSVRGTGHWSGLAIISERLWFLACSATFLFGRRSTVAACAVLV